MTAHDYRDALRLLDSLLRLLRRHVESRPKARARQARELSVEFDLLRARFGQPATERQRN